MVFQIIMILAGLFALAYGFRLKKPLARIITWGFCGAIAIRLVQVQEVAIDGYYIFALAEFLVVVYAFSDATFATSKKTIIAMCGLLCLVPLLLFLISWEGSVWGTYQLGVSGIIVLGAYVYILVRDIREYREEMGFMTVLAADALIRFSLSLMFHADRLG